MAERMRVGVCLRVRLCRSVCACVCAHASRCASACASACALRLNLRLWLSVPVHACWAAAPAPSPITKPARWTSNGRLDALGSSLYVEHMACAKGEGANARLRRSGEENGALSGGGSDVTQNSR
eukprot:510654-Pleurochrysis_carterae.AAC.2